MTAGRGREGGRRDVGAALAGMHECKGGTSTQQLFLYACVVCQKGRWHSTSDKIINVLVRSEYWKEEGGGEEGGGGGKMDRVRGIMAQEFSPRHHATISAHSNT